MATTHQTYCRNCSTHCGLVVETEGDRITSVRGDRAHPLTAGYMCIKGQISGDWHNGEDRLVQTLAREPDRSNAPVAIETALDAVHARIEEIIARHGPRAVAVYHGTGSKTNTLGVMALKSWLKTIGSPFLYSSSTLDQSAKWVTRARMGAFTTGHHTIHDADLVLVVGGNPAVSHMAAPLQPFSGSNVARTMRQAKANGLKVIVIDPRRTEFARNADLHLPVIPGEDVSLLSGMIHVILANGWEDKAFCDRFVTSLDVLREAVRDYPPAYAAQRAGVPEADLVEAARLFATARRPSSASGTGPNMSAHSNTAEHLVEALNVICGAYRRAGDLVRNMGSFTRKTAIVENVQPPSRSWENEPKFWTEDSGLVGGEFPSSRLPNEILHGGLRALIVVGGNPVTALGQPDKTLAAFAKLELLVSVDARMNDTAQLADYVFPATLPYERHDATSGYDTFHMEPFAQIAKPMVKSPEGVIDDWEFFWELASRGGRPLTLVEYKWGGIAGDNKFIMSPDEKPKGADLIRWICDQGDVSFDELMANPGGIRFDHPPLTVQPAAEDNGARLDVCPPDVAQEIRTVRSEVADGRFGYRLSVRRMIETMNSAFRDSGVTRGRWPYNPAFMNPDDMAREGLERGDPVDIESDTGKIRAFVEPDPGVRPGVVSMSHQWGALDPSDDPESLQGAFTGRLVSLDSDIEAINYMPRQSGVPVNILPARVR